MSSLIYGIAMMATCPLVFAPLAGGWWVGTRVPDSVMPKRTFWPRAGRIVFLVACLLAGAVVSSLAFQAQNYLLLPLNPSVMQWHECPAQGCP